MRSLLITVALVGCVYHDSFTDCAIACSAASGCPNGLTCSTAEGLCRTGETTSSCSTSMIDAGGVDCLSFYSDEAAFASATTAVNLMTEDFTRLAGGSATPQTFVVQNGDTFFWHTRVTFTTFGVNSEPGTRANTIAVAGAGSATPPFSIMSQAGQTARDAISAQLSTPEAALAFASQDDDGTQVFSVEVTTTNGTQAFSVPSGHTPFAGVVDTCGNAITSVTLSPPMPSGWWRLFSVSFGP